VKFFSIQCGLGVSSLLILLPLSASGNALDPVLPNSRVTPGALNPSVTQANIHSTICVRGYTRTIRPPASYTTALKLRQLSSLPYSGYGDRRTADFEEDHLISLELGGSPTDPKNLWPEPYANSTGARTKDKLENVLHALVCNGSLTLRTAQKAIAINWYSAYFKYVLRQNG
jgi:hypothetical protein